MQTTIEYRWKDGATRSFPAILFVWSLLVAYIGNSGYEEGERLLFTACLAVFLGTNYVAAAHLMNKTVFRLSPTTVDIRSSPVPWPGRRIINVLDIQSFVFRELRPEGTTRYTSFFIALRGPRRIKMFPGVRIADPRRASEVITKLCDLLRPYHPIEFTEEKMNRFL